MQVHMSFFLFSCYFFRFGLAGNHPLSTLFFCWKSSSIDQKHENANAPSRVETIVLATSKEAANVPVPTSAKAGQQPVPNQYSALMTIG